MLEVILHLLYGFSYWMPRPSILLQSLLLTVTLCGFPIQIWSSTFCPYIQFKLNSIKFTEYIHNFTNRSDNSYILLACFIIAILFYYNPTSLIVVTMATQKQSGYRILPIRDHNDMILKAKFAPPDFKDTEKLMTRMKINLLYYQSNYFLFFILWPYLFG